MNRLNLALGLALACAAAGTQAAEPCRIALDQPELDYGVLQLPTGSRLDSFQQPHALPVRNVRVRISCPAPGPLAVDLTGASEGGQARFADAGHLRLQFAQATVDGAVVDLANLNQGPTGQRELDVQPGQRIVPVNAGQPVQGSEWAMNLLVTPSLPLGELRRADETLLQGSLALQLAE